MKKIIALLIALSCLVALVSCGKNEVDTVGDRFEASKPTRTLIATTQQFGDIVLEAEYTLTTGLVDGAAASVYEATYDEMLSVEGGATEVIQGSVVERYELREYLEGYGVRTNGGAWDPDAEDFASESGPMSLNLSSKYIKTFEYADNKLKCVVAAKNTAEVLGVEDDLAVDISLEVVDDGASVTSVIISYTLPADSASGVPETNITIKAFYFYDHQKITIDVK